MITIEAFLDQVLDLALDGELEPDDADSESLASLAAALTRRGCLPTPLWRCH